MRPFISSIQAAALCRLLSYVTASSAHNFGNAIEYPINRVLRSDHEYSSVPMHNERWIYTVEISIGDPPQKTLVQVDTGSSELWVNANCSSAPVMFGQQTLCRKVPKYDVDSSRSASGPVESKTLGYGSGSEIIGAMVDIYEDTVVVGDIQVTNQKFGVASDTRGLPVGIMGLGPVFNSTFAVNESYHLLLDSMAEQGAIGSRAYSLGLGTADDKQGSLIFGGLDKGRFSGTLKKVSVITSRDGGARFTVNLTSIGADTGNGATKKYTLKDPNVHIDSGHTFSRLDKSLVDQIVQDLGATFDKELGFYLIDCKAREHPGSVTFGFGSKTISVPLREFIYTAQGQCAVAIEAIQDGQQQVLGDNFLRAAYVIFDLDNRNVHFAQAAECAPEVVAIGSGKDAVPSVTGNCRSNSTPTASASEAPSSTGSAADLPSSSSRHGVHMEFLLGLCAPLLLFFGLALN